MEKQLTAMQQLLQQFRNENKSGWFSFDEVEQNILDFGIPKEKQQIIDAHLIGLITSLETEATKQATEYYNNNFKQ